MDGERGGEHGAPVCVCGEGETITPFYFKSHVLSIKEAKVGNRSSMLPWLETALQCHHGWKQLFNATMDAFGTDQSDRPLHPSISLSDLSTSLLYFPVRPVHFTPLIPCQTCPTLYFPVRPVHPSTSLSDMFTSPLYFPVKPVHFTCLLSYQTCPLHLSTSPSDLSTPLLPCHTCPLHLSTSLSDLSTCLLARQTCPLHLSTSPSDLYTPPSDLSTPLVYFPSCQGPTLTESELFQLMSLQVHRNHVSEVRPCCKR